MDPKPNMMAIQALIALILAVFQLLFFLCLACANSLLTQSTQESGEDEPSENPVLDFFSQERGTIIDEVANLLTITSRRLRFLQEVWRFFLDNNPERNSLSMGNIRNFDYFYDLIKDFVKEVNNWMNQRLERTATNQSSGISNSNVTCLPATANPRNDCYPHQPEAMQPMATNSQTIQEVLSEKSTTNTAAMSLDTVEQRMQNSESEHLNLVPAGCHATDEMQENKDDFDIRVRRQGNSPVNSQNHPEANPAGKADTAQTQISLPESHVPHQASKTLTVSENHTAIGQNHTEGGFNAAKDSRTGSSPAPPQAAGRLQELCQDDDNDSQTQLEVCMTPSVTMLQTTQSVSSFDKEPSVHPVQNAQNRSSKGPTHHDSDANMPVVISPRDCSPSSAVTQDKPSTHNNHSLAIPENNHAMKRSRSLPIYMSGQVREKSLTRKTISLNSVLDRNLPAGSAWMLSTITMPLTSDKDIQPRDMATGLNPGTCQLSSRETEGQPSQMKDTSSEDNISLSACAPAFHPTNDPSRQPSHEGVMENEMLKKSVSPMVKLLKEETTENAACSSKATDAIQLEASVDSTSWVGRKHKSRTRPMQPAEERTSFAETMSQAQVEKRPDKDTTGHFGNDKPRESQRTELSDRKNNFGDDCQTSASNGRGHLEGTDMKNSDDSPKPK